MDETIRATLAHMSLERKAGQLLAIGFDGTEVGPELTEMLARYAIGGLVLFARNVESPAQVAKLANTAQAVARQNGLPGLILAIDQEGGRVARLTEDTGFTEFPSAMALGASGNAQNAFLAARAIARELRAVGLNTDFAPVLDVNNNTTNPVIGTRSFGFDPRQVAEYGAAFLNGLQTEGILAFGKHFPGHGDTAQDSHFHLPVVTRDRQRLEAIELVPFRAAIRAGIGAIMSAHIHYPALDPDGLPATLSPRVMTGLIRQELGFEGLLATDSLEMGALASAGYPAPLAAAMAIQAGADLLLFNRDHELHRQAHSTVVEWVREGKISRSRLDEAVRRVLETKQRFGMLDPAPVDPQSAPGLCGTVECRQLSRDMAEKAILYRQGAVHLPVHSGLVLAVHATITFPDKAIRLPGAAKLAQQLGFPMLAITEDPDDAETATILLNAQTAACAGNIIIATLFDAKYHHPAQLDMVKMLAAQDIPLVVVAMGSPFDLKAIPQNITALAAYGSDPPSLDALAERLGGNT